MTPSAARAAIAFAALTFIFYLLWSKGFSPQWVLYLIAFLCILLPTFLGTVLIALLEVLYVIEWPITFILLNANAGYLTALVIVRTAVPVASPVFLPQQVLPTDRAERSRAVGDLVDERRHPQRLIDERRQLQQTVNLLARLQRQGGLSAAGEAMLKSMTVNSFPNTISLRSAGLLKSVSSVPRSFSPAVRSTAG